MERLSTEPHAIWLPEDFQRIKRRAGPTSWWRIRFRLKLLTGYEWTRWFKLNVRCWDHGYYRLDMPVYATAFEIGTGREDKFQLCYSIDRRPERVQTEAEQNARPCEWSDFEPDEITVMGSPAWAS